MKKQMAADLIAVMERDPACDKYSQPLLYFKGFQALQAYRVSHLLWTQGRKSLALALQSRVSEVFQVVRATLTAVSLSLGGSSDSRLGFTLRGKKTLHLVCTLAVVLLSLLAE